MAGPTVTYTFTNGTTADGPNVSTNFTDLINGLTDGTKDLSVSAITAAGTVTFNGDVNLGNASTDDLTVNAALASTINIKTTATYNIGSATLGLAGIYLGANSQTVRLIGSASMSATYTITLPVAAGVKGQVAQNAGSGVLAWVPGQSDMKNTGDAAYTILDDDGYRTVVSETPLTVGRIVTLPTASANTDRIITIKKGDAGAFALTVDGEGAETIDGAATVALTSQYDSLTVQSNGTTWHELERRILASSTEDGMLSYYATEDVELDDPGNGFTGGDKTVRCTRIGNAVTISCVGIPTHGALATVTSSAIIPAAYRPATDMTTIYNYDASTVSMLTITSAGVFNTYYRDWAGGNDGETTTHSPPCISYNV